ncbi:MAG: membrane protein insertion efficiency factor YidD [Burkholderiaceae bacterium]|nr:membrane protein insertion efficiency factor YidD [Burkholderiaceae bacterium]
MWPRALLILPVRGYRLLLSPWLGSSCRFEPTCSAYTLTALRRHGALRGGLLGAARIGRCHPWCAGGHDPVPPAGTGLFTALLGRHGRAGPASDSETSAAASEPRKNPV